MTNILIVDDEPMLLKALEHTLHHELGLKNIKKAYSGIEAIEILENYSIDIVVTDIRMPGMDGIKLSHYIHENLQHTKCIILSGYAEFEYAKNAMKYNVVEYLIKPVKDEELINAITKTILILEEERGREEYRQGLSVLKSKLLSDLLMGKIFYDKDLERKLCSLDINFKEGDSFTLMMLRLDKWFSHSLEEERHIFEYAIINVVNESIEETFNYWQNIDVSGTIIYLLKCKNMNDQSKFHNLIKEKCVQIQEHVSQFLKGEISILVSELGTFPHDLLSMHHNSLNQLWKLPKDKDITIIGRERNIGSMEKINSLYVSPTLHQLLESGRWNDAKNNLNIIQKEINENKLDTEGHKNEVFYTVINALISLAHMKGNSLWELIGNDAQLLKGPQSFRDIDSVIEWSMATINLIENELGKEEGNNQQKTIEKIQMFVEDNYADATLQTIADHVNIHPVYLSTLYKRVSNENISDFILRTRMEKAKDLLLTTDIKIYQLAIQCGFQNPPYFSKIFKTYFGVSPQEYRERHQGIIQ